MVHVGARLAPHAGRSLAADPQRVLHHGRSVSPRALDNAVVVGLKGAAQVAPAPRSETELVDGDFAPQSAALRLEDRLEVCDCFIIL